MHRIGDNQFICTIHVNIYNMYVASAFIVIHIHIVKFYILQ